MDIWIDKKDIIVEKSLNIGVSGNARAKLKIPINRGYIEYIIINDIPIKNIKNYENRIKELEELETDLKGQELDLYHREKKNARVNNPPTARPITSVPTALNTNVFLLY